MSAKTILALDTKTGDQATVYTPPEHLQWLSVDFIKERLADPYRCSGGPQDRVFLDYLLALVESLTAERDALRARLAAVEALADQWADRKRSDGMSGNAWIGLTLSGVAADLRAALATTGEGQ